MKKFIIWYKLRGTPECTKTSKVVIYAENGEMAEERFYEKLDRHKYLCIAVI